MDWLLAFFALPGTATAIAGGFGGVARWLFVILVDGKLGPKQGPAFVLLGAILGHYVSDIGTPVARWALSGFDVDPAKLPVFAAFAIGVGGVGLVALGLDWFAQRRKKLDDELGVAPSADKPNGGIQ